MMTLIELQELIFSFYYSCLPIQARCREEQISCLNQKSCLNQTLFNLLFHFWKSEILFKSKMLLKSKLKSKNYVVIIQHMPQLEVWHKYPSVQSRFYTVWHMTYSHCKKFVCHFLIFSEPRWVLVQKSVVDH